MKEIDFYKEFAEKFIKYLKGYLNEEYEIAYSYNKSLDSMIEEICAALNSPDPFAKDYIPKLKLDILFGINFRSKIHFILIEAKYLSKLSLKDYSQLTGYMQVARNIGTGLLLLIIKNNSPNSLSSDFGEILRLNKLPMDWEVKLKGSDFKFRTGILTYCPGNGIDWIHSNNVNGISSFEQLIKNLFPR